MYEPENKHNMSSLIHESRESIYSDFYYKLLFRAFSFVHIVSQ